MIYLKRNSLKYALLVAFTAAIILRTPHSLYPPRFWGEDGTQFFCYAHNNGLWSAFIKTHQGYHSLWCNCAGIIASLVPLTEAPLVTTLAGLLSQLSSAIIVLWGGIESLGSPLKKSLALCILLLVPSNTEVGLNVANSQFLFCTACGLILVGDTRTLKGPKRILLLIASINGPVSCFLTPVFLLKAWREKSAERFVQFLILFCGTLVELLSLYYGRAETHRPLVIGANRLVGVIFSHLFLAPFTTRSLFTFHLEALNGAITVSVWLLVAVFMVSILYCIRHNKDAKWLCASSFVVLVCSLLGVLDATTKDLMLYGDRYFYAPQVLLFIALLVCALGNCPKERLILKAALGIFLLLGAIEYPVLPPQITEGLSWQGEVEKWKQDHTYKLHVWPSFMTMELKP